MLIEVSQSDLFDAQISNSKSKSTDTNSKKNKISLIFHHSEDESRQNVQNIFIK